MTALLNSRKAIFSVVNILQGALLGSLLVSGMVVAESAIEWRGSWQQGALLLGRVKPGQVVTYGGESLETTSQGYFLLGLDREAGPVSRVTVRNADGTEVNEEQRVAARSYAIQRVNGVPQKTVEPAPEDLARIASDQKLVNNARKVTSNETGFLNGFVAPIEGPVTGVYGSQRVYNGIPKSPHYGVDYAAPKGAIVRAPASGVVRLAHKDLFYSGGTLIIDHGHNLTSSFLHLSDILVSEGMHVERGDTVAKVGATGRATGPHLDWRMNWRDVRVDPQLVLQALPAE
ncbi:MAG: M23 family metallopeptidase [Porticoccaceae bacterium]|jgi:murein DD-endopeptidase MepM/ murein hydrolase activator NlpD|nr:M23 family metallopeptidase [Alphaproteobacteria bacterium]MDP4745802.1 M23 family metallopeptidase [Porticoccaceae bacterium]MDP4753750.1 M23 family metallopeptidase [Porticoccaceae bacterium]MDP5051201.1 M23 family metallopeptidase [Porticoccaceae bacterium]